MSGDLISKSGLMEDFRNTITEKSNTFDWLNMISRQKAAYDVEKVIDKLKENEQEITSHLEEIAKNAPNAVQETTLKVTAQLFRDYTKSQIEIVKSGGIDAGQKGERE